MTVRAPRLAFELRDLQSVTLHLVGRLHIVACDLDIRTRVVTLTMAAIRGGGTTACGAVCNWNLVRRDPSELEEPQCQQPV